LPIEDGWVDVVISNGVINLCPDKIGVYWQIFRVLRPGGRMTLADICLERPSLRKRFVTSISGRFESPALCRAQGGRR
jgi:SAM-dependent methyltransferase